MSNFQSFILFFLAVILFGLVLDAAVTGIWIGMLMAAEVPIPKSIYVHGFITSEGQKMSKSLGNVVDPLEYVEKYGTDALRYFLMREIPTTDDGDFSHGRFVEIYNSELANGLGNLVNRVVMMTEKYAEGKVPKGSGDMSDEVKEYFDKYDAEIARFSVGIIPVDLAVRFTLSIFPVYPPVIVVPIPVTSTHRWTRAVQP